MSTSTEVLLEGGTRNGRLLTVAYVLKVFPRLSETFVINEIRAIEAMGIRVVIYSLHRPQEVVDHGILRDIEAPIHYVDDEEMPSDESVRLALRKLERLLGLDDQLRRSVLPRKYVRLALALRELIAGAGVDHIHAHFASRAGHVTAIVGTMTGVPYSITAHAKDIYHEDVDRNVLVWQLAAARFVITVTDFNRRYLRDLLGPEAGARVRRVYNGVDLSRFDVVPYESAEAGRILGVGRLVEKKGFDVLVEACRILRDRGCRFFCEIVGGGAEESALRAQVNGAGLSGRVLLTGALPTEDVAGKMALASVVVLPCVAGRDGNVDALPTVLLEAMARGRPVISTRLSGIPEIVEDGETGILVEPRDAAALADALERVLEDRAGGSRMGAGGRARAERLFDLTSNASEVGRELLLSGAVRSCA